jgi:transcriptional repressor NrdR
MLCPYCRNSETRVIETRKPDLGTVKRRRVCPDCGRRFVTTERIATHEIQVRKRSGDLEPFARQKIARSIIKAGSGQHLLPAVVDAFVERVVDQLAPPTDGVPISTQEIGNLVLQSLDDNTNSTDVVRVRFAMVFLGRLDRQSAFADAHGLKLWLESNYPQLAELVDTGFDDVVVIKRNGQRESFDLNKLERSVGIAAKGRGTDQDVHAFATHVGEQVLADLSSQSIISSQQIAASVLHQLLARDEIAYLRYASITKRYASVLDFFREASFLAQSHSTR